MKKPSRIASLLLVLAMVVLLLGSFPVWGAQPTEKEVKLVAYMPGDKPRDGDAWLEELNKMLKRDINATLEVNYLPWGDLNTKYPLVLASGQDIDLTVAADWLKFPELAQKGAFMDIKDLVGKYAPDLVKMSPKAAWKACTINGKLYAIPDDGKQSTIANGIAYREDLRIKYKVPEIKKFTDFEAYFNAIKKNEKDMVPFNIGADEYWITQECYMTDRLGINRSGVIYRATKVEDPTAKVFNACETPQFRDYVTLMAKWKNEGFWTANVFSNKTRSKDLLPEGKSAAAEANPGDYKDIYQRVASKHQDWKVRFWYPTTPAGHVPFNAGPTWAIAAASKNPERALMFLNLVETKKEYAELLYYGMKGKNWKRDADGYGVYADGVTSETTGFNFGCFPLSWMIYNKAEVLNERPSVDTPIMKEIGKQAYSVATFGMTIDTSKIKAEMAALNDVEKQYLNPLQVGFIKTSVKEDIATLNAKLKAAGLNKVIAENQKQNNEYIKKNKK